MSTTSRTVQVIAQLEQLPQTDRVLITIDGPCGSGKSTLAAALAEKLSCPVVHMDDYVIPHAQKTPERLAIPGGNADQERLPDSAAHATVRLFLTIEPEEQQRRLLWRVGAERLTAFNARWIPLEQAYFAAFGLPDGGCIVLD